MQTLKEAKDCITALVVNEHKIISASLDGCVRHYDLRAGQLTCDKIGIPVISLTQTSDEQCLLASCQDETIRLIDIEGGEILTEYTGKHRGSKDFKLECGVLKSDSLIITGSSGGRAVIYDFLEASVTKELNISTENTIIQSLCKHPTNDDVLFAVRREIQLWTADEEIMEED